MTHMRSGGVYGHAREWRPDGTCMTRGRVREGEREREKENVCVYVCVPGNEQQKKK